MSERTNTPYPTNVVANQPMTGPPFYVYTQAVPAVNVVHPTMKASVPRKMAMTGTLKATEDKGVYLIKATRVGAHAYTWDGYALTWTKEALVDCAESWTFGTVSVNHDGKTYGTIDAAWFDDPFVYHRIRVNEELDGWIERNIESGGVGVSIEAELLEADYDTLSILKARGTGVAIVLYPERPACSSEEGCGIVPPVADSEPDDEPSVASVSGSAHTDRESMIQGANEMTENEDVTIKVEANESAELTAIIAERDKLAAKVAELEAANAALIAKERADILASIRDKVGEHYADFEDMTVCELRLVAKAIAAYESTLDLVPEVSSGATGDAIMATEAPAPDEAEKAKVEATLKDLEGRLGIKLTD